MKANIYHLIKGYDLLTLELVLMASKAEFLKAVVTSREPKLSKVSCVIYVRLLWGFFTLFLCSSESRTLVVCRNYRSSRRILLVYYSCRCPCAEHLGWLWEGRWKGCPAKFAPCGQGEKESKKSQLCLNRQPGRQSQCYLFAPTLCTLLCPWIWDFRFIIKILAASSAVAEFANTCTGPSHFLNPGCRMPGERSIMHFTKCFSSCK